MKLKYVFVFLTAALLINETHFAQTISVQGKVTASRYPVKAAQVTFINNSDTTIQYQSVTDSLGNYYIGLPTSVEEAPNNIPSGFELEQSYPNPFSSSAAIPYKLKKESDVQLTIYDVLGKVVRKFNVGPQGTGYHNVLWDGRNSSGSKVANGIYLYRLQADGKSQVRKMIFSGTSGGMIQLPRMHSGGGDEIQSLKKQSTLGAVYNVRIENIYSTLPAIINQSFNTITLQRDTTISFGVSYIPTASIDAASSHQLIRGFGAANIIGWRPDMTDTEIETAFGAGDGQLGFSILRLRISPDSTQWNVNVHSAKKAADKGVLIFASPWTPPASMKTNNNLIGGELNESSYAEYANHLKRFGDYMKTNGVPMYALSLQNEPDISVSYESCDWSSSQFIKFLRENGPSVGYRIIAPESFQFRHQLSDPILNDSLACANLDIVGGHIYGGGLIPYPLAEQKGKELWMTEHLTESSHSANNWNLAMDVAVEISDVMKANMNAYVWWYIVRYYGPIGDGEKSVQFPNENFSKKGEITKKGYVMSQFARFIRPGYYRIDSGEYPSAAVNGVEVTAYRDPASSKMVIVAVNSGSDFKKHVFKIDNDSLMRNFTPYTTSASKNCERGTDFTMTDGTITFNLEPSSITTFVSY